MPEIGLRMKVCEVSEADPSVVLAAESLEKSMSGPALLITGKLITSAARSRVRDDTIIEW
jgi:hypothetical protein